MSEGPDDPVSKLKLMLLEDRRELKVQRRNLTMIDEISNLPAQRAIIFQPGNYLVDNPLLPRHVIAKRALGLVCLTNVVGGRSHN